MDREIKKDMKNENKIIKNIYNEEDDIDQLYEDLDDELIIDRCSMYGRINFNVVDINNDSNNLKKENEEIKYELKLERNLVNNNIIYNNSNYSIMFINPETSFLKFDKGKFENIYYRNIIAYLNNVGNNTFYIPIYVKGVNIITTDIPKTNDRIIYMFCNIEKILYDVVDIIILRYYENDGVDIPKIVDCIINKKDLDEIYTPSYVIKKLINIKDDNIIFISPVKLDNSNLTVIDLENIKMNRKKICNHLYLYKYLKSNSNKFVLIGIQ